jgi:regulator of cell morphogenesis and NO signaling
MTDLTMIHPAATLADLATNWAGASRVFQRHDLDFCCQGKRTLADACRQRHLPVDELLAELRAELTPIAAVDDWRERPLVQIIAHVVDHFHAGHRAELPRLIAMAEKVERVHGGKPGCPVGLAAHLLELAHSLEQHMQKEEDVLFPMIVAGAGKRAWAPIQCLTAEHDDHGRALARMRELAHGYVPPPHACGTWRALYLGLADFEREVMEHVHLENHVLFARTLQGAGALP